MLQSVLFGFIPAVIGLAAAFYIMRKIYTTEEENGFRGGPQTFPTFQTERTSRSESQNTQPRLRRNNRQAGDGLSQCAVCFEDSRIVELYPCRHKDICEVCTAKIISMSSKICPFCRCNIKGYRLLD